MELIDLNNSDATTLRKHLLETFGVEKAANTSREKLVAAILEQEQAQGVDRQAGDAASQSCRERQHQHAEDIQSTAYPHRRP